MAHFFNPGSAVPDICCTNGCGKPASDAIHRANHKPLVPLYSLGGDVFTTKAPECGECGFTVRKDGSCGFCQ